MDIQVYEEILSWILLKCKLLMKYTFHLGNKVFLQLFLDGFAEIKGQSANFNPKGDK